MANLNHLLFQTDEELLLISACILLRSYQDVQVTNSSPSFHLLRLFEFYLPNASAIISVQVKPVSKRVLITTNRDDDAAERYKAKSAGRTLSKNKG